MLRIGSRAAIAAGEDFAVVHQALQHDFSGLRGGRAQHFGGLLLGFDALGEMLGHAVL